jgi:ubiquinone/menaquinone biosynthesis C-methylase UbiE
MKAQEIAIRESQKASWNSFSPGWEKWDDFTMRFLQSQGQQIVNHLDLESADKVLDIASGTGEPGLSIAASVQQGYVTAVDLSEGMTRIARDKAASDSLYNFSTQVADACELPFGDNTFDKISCRLGFMFFPDMHQAAREMNRVLKPGGKIVGTVWGSPEDNCWITTILGVIKKRVELPTPPPGGPGLFRCAQPGLMSGLLHETGWNGAHESEIHGSMSCDSAEEYWQFMNDVVPPVVAACGNMDPDQRELLKKELEEILDKNASGMLQDLSCCARLFMAQKPA